MPYHEGKLIDPADVFEGAKFADSDGLKTLLLKDKDRIARALATKLVTYATGAAPSAIDKPTVDESVTRSREKDYGLRTMVQEVVRSELFRLM